jgi:hypothetical protein
MNEPCHNCGTLLFWFHKWPYEVGKKIDYFEGCGGLVYDNLLKQLRYADHLYLKPKQVTPRHHCANYDKTLKKTDKKVFDKELDTLF